MPWLKNNFIFELISSYAFCVYTRSFTDLLIHLSLPCVVWFELRVDWSFTLVRCVDERITDCKAKSTHLIFLWNWQFISRNRISLSVAFSTFFQPKSNVKLAVSLKLLLSQFKVINFCVVRGALGSTDSWCLRTLQNWNELALTVNTYPCCFITTTKTSCEFILLQGEKTKRFRIKSP